MRLCAFEPYRCFLFLAEPSGILYRFSGDARGLRARLNFAPESFGLLPAPFELLLIMRGPLLLKVSASREDCEGCRRVNCLVANVPTRPPFFRKKLDALSVPLKDERFDLVDEEVLAISHCCKLGGD